MPQIATHRQSVIALGIAFALCLTATLITLRHARDYLALRHQSDFRVYYVASDMVRAHLDLHLYDEAATGGDPQFRYASDTSVIAKIAHSKGIERTQFYLYPPFLADVLLPFTWLSASKAAWAWRLLNLCTAVLTAGLLSRLLGYKPTGIPALLVLTGLFCFSPLWQAFYYGQITIVLFALWTAGILSYAEGAKRASALLLSAAVLIKLTPLLIIVPILIWHDWRWLRWFTGSTAIGFILVCLKSSPRTVFFYFLRVVPPMSEGILDRQNKTVLAAVGTFWFHGLTYKGITAPLQVVLAGKLLCLALVATAALLTYRPARNLPTTGRLLVMAAFALLSLCVSPVTWVDALIIGYILLALLWKRMLAGGRPFSELLLLFVTTIATGTSVAIGSGSNKIDNYIFFQYAPLIFSLLLVFYVLARCGELSSKHSAIL